MIWAWNNKRIPVMLIHPASAGAGLNLQDGGSTLIWFTLTTRLDHYIQTNGRLMRRGQTKPVQILRMLTKGTLQTRVPGTLKVRQTSQDGTLQYIALHVAHSTTLPMTDDQLLLSFLVDEMSDQIGSFGLAAELL